MNIAALRALVLDVGTHTFGVAAIITPPGGEAITATGVWLPSLTEDPPVGRDFQRREPRRVLAFRLAEVVAVPRGSMIEAAEYGGAPRVWTVDGVEQQTAEQIRVVVVPLIP